ncbi:MAG: VCBS repeat-containing protein, partial [Planctomycetota bacterium]|nr:VCBS repeat-containing protein [Planctomycetota bacterium]
MRVKTSKALSISTAITMFVFGGPVLAGEHIFGEPVFWGFAYDFGTAPGDFDGDGDIDLFTVHPPVYDGFGQLIDPGNYTINFNTDGQGSFNDQTITDEEGAYAVFVSDLNDDGALDVIDDDIGVMLGNGDGTFGPIITYTNGHGTSHALGFGDMDNDGDIDIVAPNGGPVLLNHGDGTFYTEFVSSDVAGGIGVGVGDVDEDGHLDIVTVDGYDPVITIQLGLGDGFGNPGPPYTVTIGQSEPEDMALVDMNSDGHLDVVTLNGYPSDSVTVIFGNGDGTFGSPTTYEPHEPANYNVLVFKVVAGDVDDL